MDDFNGLVLCLRDMDDASGNDRTAVARTHLDSPDPPESTANKALRPDRAADLAFASGTPPGGPIGGIRGGAARGGRQRKKKPEQGGPSLS